MIEPAAADDHAWRAAIGRSATFAQILDLSSIARYAAALGADPDGATPPVLWHWAFFHDIVPDRGLGKDGHRLRGSFLPDIPDLPRRMFAATTIDFLWPLVSGDEARLTLRIADLTAKAGQGGKLVFAELDRSIEQAGRVCLRERQTLVYRAAAILGASLPTPAPDAGQVPASGELWRPGTVNLFRFSAATFNSHRIHYDRRYAADIEGYPDLVVQGPMIAARLADLAARRGVLSQFTYRASGPSFVDQSIRLIEDIPGQLKAIRADGVVVATATSALRQPGT